MYYFSFTHRSRQQEKTSGMAGVAEVILRADQLHHKHQSNRGDDKTSTVNSRETSSQFFSPKKSGSGIKYLAWN